MTHPDIKTAELRGYIPRELYREKPIGVCLFCGSDIYRNGKGYVKSFDGIFCDMECCHEFYEIRERVYD